ncbi:glycoside hydrolase family 9 protein [Aminobacter aganoensis]|uniref:Endoglucanase n=1 Tax=Aminobacter aganoensis TaxID=83264 RepID=A0A7X0FB77_9HYPH|nr:glycoside hydrolase family 9 protein [Aminobacter aganoensis]MBB6356508.1 endoglucanase [Aminobacter aganoensis]
MAAPDIIAVELRDPQFVHGRIVTLPKPMPDMRGRWTDVDGVPGLVIGPKADNVRLSDTPPGRFLDRKSIDDAGLYGDIGGRRVISVYRKSMPYDSGLYPGPNGDTRTGAAFKHQVYLRLDGPLPQGTHVIRWPNGVLADQSFTFDDRATRAMAIRSTLLGHATKDTAKTGFLALWLPGGNDDGAVDFRDYGIDSFDIVDPKGRTVFSGAISLRKSPGDPEPGNGLPKPLINYTNAIAPRIAIRSLDPNSRRVTTVVRHNLVDGQRVGLERLGGDQDASAIFAIVSEVKGSAFTLAEPTGPLPATLSPQATVTPAYSANRAGTFVFELDYSAWAPQAGGPYRLRIRGLGVSDPFRVDPDTWLNAARNSMTGLYHQRSGIAIDGRFGYSRPVAFRPGADMSIVESRLPLAWSSNFDTGFIAFEEGVKPRWRTDRKAPDSYWGGYMDAGDWDRRIQHVEVASLLLETFEALPEGQPATSFNLPKSSTLLTNPAYRDTDDLPDLIHEAIWVMDFFRRLQTDDGSIRGGIESAAHPMLGEPSYLERQEVYAYAPDHISTYKYAAVAAKLARILKTLGKSDAAKLFEDSARAAWAAAEPGFADPDTYYRDAILAATASGSFGPGGWPARREQLQAIAREYRGAAAAALYRLLDSPEHRDIFEAYWREDQGLFAHKGDAAWDYLKTAGSDAEIGEEITARFAAEAAIITGAQQHAAYPNMKHPDAPAGWGEGGAPDYNQTQTLIRAHLLSANPQILQVMEQGYQAMVGVNQVGLSFVTGIGARQILHPLHEDHRAMGVDAPSGITIFGFASQSATAYSWVFGPAWSPLAESGTAENAAQRRIEPPRFSLPYHEYLVEHPAVIMQQEFTVHQSIATMAALALYLHGRQ